MTTPNWRAKLHLTESNDTQTYRLHELTSTNYWDFQSSTGKPSAEQLAKIAKDAGYKSVADFEADGYRISKLNDSVNESNDYASMKAKAQDDIDRLTRGFDSQYDTPSAKLDMYYTGGFCLSGKFDGGTFRITWDKTDYVVQDRYDRHVKVQVLHTVPKAEYDPSHMPAIVSELSDVIENDLYDVPFKVSHSVKQSGDNVILIVNGESKGAISSTPAAQKNVGGGGQHYDPQQRYMDTPGAKWQAQRQQRARDAGNDNFGGHDANYRF